MATKGYKYVGTVGKWLQSGGATLKILLEGPDDIFVREDLAQEKYQIDFEAAKEFETYYFDKIDQTEEMDPIMKSKEELQT